MNAPDSRRCVFSKQACLPVYQLPFDLSVQNQSSPRKWKITHLSNISRCQELPQLLMCSRRKPLIQSACLPSPCTSEVPKGYQKFQIHETGDITTSGIAGSHQAQKAPFTTLGETALNDQAEHAAVPNKLLALPLKFIFKKMAHTTALGHSDHLLRFWKQSQLLSSSSNPS